MLLRINDVEYDSNRVPVAIYWKTKKEKEGFVKTVIDINSVRKFTDVTSFTTIKASDIVVKNTVAVAIKFGSKEEKAYFLRQLYDLGSDCNMYVATPSDIPNRIIEEWLKVSIVELGLKKSTSIELSRL